MDRQDDLEKFEERIGYQYRNRELMVNALSHSSYVNEKHLPKEACNERLEFLGDAVLELVSSEFLFGKHEEMSEGQLSRTRVVAFCKEM